MENYKENNSRRKFLKDSAKVTAGAAFLTGFPTIVPASVFGKYAPSNRINVGAIGTGRISRTHDMPGVWSNPNARITAVCDLDSKRLAEAKDLVNKEYGRQKHTDYKGVQAYENYEDLIANKDIDAVLISTPDHWHVLPALAAVRAGKDVYMQKPASLTISEGRILSDEVKRTGRIFQIGSQQRSMPQFKRACELVRNGMIGKVHTIYVGLPIDDPREATVEKEMPVPSNLNYDKWLGPTPEVYYTEKRVHPQEGYGRPGWLRCEQFGAGMITGWGAHHFDIVNWALDTEFTGPIEVSGLASYPAKEMLWDVHGPYRTEMVFENGTRVHASNMYPNGVKFMGTEGWIFVTRGNYSVTASDPVPKGNSKALEASNPKILTASIPVNGVHLYESRDHHNNWIDCIKSRKEPITPIEVGHRACTVCLLNHITMKLQRKLNWDPVNELFVDDAEANTYLKKEQRKGFDIS